MRGAWGKPYGTVARVNIGQVILSIRCKDANAPVVMEALRRARYKFPGRQKIVISKKWGFTKFDREQYAQLRKVIPPIPLMLFLFFIFMPFIYFRIFIFYVLYLFVHRTDALFPMEPTSSLSTTTDLLLPTPS